MTRSFSVGLIATVLLASCGGAPRQRQAIDTVPVSRTPTRPEVPRLRLPNTVVPSRYSAELSLSPDRRDFEGAVNIAVHLRAPTSVIWLNAAGLTVLEARVGSDRAMPVQSGEFLGLELPRELEAGDVAVTVRYRGHVPQSDSRGLYHQEDAGAHYLFTQFESTDARRAFPCFDEPGFKTPWKLTLVVPKKYAAFANTPVEKEEPHGDTKTMVFAETKPLPSYLLAFAVGPLEVVDAGTAGMKQTPIRIITTRGRTGDVAYAAKVTGEILTRLERYFGMPYPYEKIDHIAVPQKNGAMENPGLITFGTNLIYGDRAGRSLQQERRYLGVATHELAHIWFGDLVTTAWWDDIWLNEAFATWMAAKIVDEWHPEWNEFVDDVRITDHVMGEDALTSVRKIRQPIETVHDIANAFDGITYQKGRAVIKSFEHWVGEQAFRKGVTQYLTRYAHKSGTSAAFLETVAAESGHPGEFAPAFSSFLDQPGVPLVSAELKCDEKPRLVVSQRRYRTDGIADGSLWQIPMCIEYPGAHGVVKSCTLVKDEHTELALKDAVRCPAWVLGNEGPWGYYRVQYQGELLKKVLERGRKELTAAERLSLLGDVDALARSGELVESEALTQAVTFADDKNREVVELTAKTLGALSFHFVSDELRDNYRRLVDRLYGARATALGWVPHANEDEDTQLLRLALVPFVAREADAGPLKAEARKLADKWLSDHAALAPDTVTAVLAVAARDGDRAFWERLYAAARTEKDRKNRGYLLMAMSKFRDPAIVRENLAIVLKPEFDAREAMTLMWGTTDDRNAMAIAYDFLKQNFDAVVARLPPDSGGGLAGMGGGFCDREHRADVESFFTGRTTKFLGGPRSLAQTLERIDQCVTFRERQEKSIEEFLRKPPARKGAPTSP